MVGIVDGEIMSMLKPLKQAPPINGMLSHIKIFTAAVRDHDARKSSDDDLQRALDDLIEARSRTLLTTPPSRHSR